MLMPATLIAALIVAFFTFVASKVATSAVPGATSPAQWAAQDHLFPSPAAPPQVASVPPPSHVMIAASAVEENSPKRQSAPSVPSAWRHVLREVPCARVVR